MAETILRGRTEPEACPYLPGRTMCLEHRVMVGVSPAELEALLERGWRRFGVYYYRPRCAACSACESLRVPVAAFRPSRSQRRVARRGTGIRLSIGSPAVDRTRLELHAAWHDWQRGRRGWREGRLDARSYGEQFCMPHDAAREFAYLRHGELVGVGLVDETPNALSSVYFYFDPRHARLSLGVLSALAEIEHARRTGRRHVYLGYRVRGCPSLDYKGAFRPHEVLVAPVGAGRRPSWRAAPGAGSGRVAAARAASDDRG